MVKKQNAMNSELNQRFSLRKLSIGLASVAISSFWLVSTTGNKVQAAENSAGQKAQAAVVTDETNIAGAKKNTSAANETFKTNEVVATNKVATNKAVTNETVTNKAATNKAETNEVATNEAGTNMLNVKAATDKAGINTTSAVKANTASISTSQTANAVPTEAKENEVDSAATTVSKANTVSKETKSNITDSTVSTKIKLQTIKLAKPVATKTLAESKVATDNQFNFDDWTTQIDNTYLNITGYKGDRSKQIVVPNGVDFAKAGKNDKNLQVAIDKNTLAGLIVDGVAPKLSNTNGQKIVANGSNWSNAFYNKGLHDISGLANLDTSNVTNMNSMFADDGQISDLSSLANWNIGNVTDMGDMFEANWITDLSPLANWKTDKVTDMSGMFEANLISNLSPLTNWNTGNVTKMYSMFDNNQISDLSPLANWKTDKVTDMHEMFENNRQISDLSPLANWKTDKVINMKYMFSNNQISDLSPLANWKTDKVTDMKAMFSTNQIRDLSPLANWMTDKVTDMSGMFESNKISDLAPLANWKTDKVTDMSSMFNINEISDLSPLANWKTDKVTNMEAMFKENRINDLRSLANWNTGNVTDMGDMFYTNQISDLSPLANWKTDKVTDMGNMFDANRISNLAPLANWNTGNVTNMDYMFCGNSITDLSPLANWNTGEVTHMIWMFTDNKISDLSPLANWNTGNVTGMDWMFEGNKISDLSPLANWNTSNVTNMEDIFDNDPLNSAFNSQSTLNKFHVIAYKLDNIGALASHSESKTFNDGSQILLDNNVVTEDNSATLTFKANIAAGNTYQIKIYNPNDKSIDIQAASLPTALGTTYTDYQDGYTIITNEFINSGSVSQDISITTQDRDTPIFAQYQSISGLITVTKDKENLGSIDIAYQNVSNISNNISAPYIGSKPYINHTQNTFYFQPQITGDQPNEQYNFIKSARLTITVPNDVTIDPDTFIDTVTEKTLKATKIADNQYQVVLDNQYQVVLNDTTPDGIAVKGLINVPADKLANGTVHLLGFGMKYTINTYNDKVAPLVATGTSKELSVIPDLAFYHGDLIKINSSRWAFDRNSNKIYDYTSQDFTNEFNGVPLEPVVSTRMTNGVETFDMPVGVNITNFEPPFSSDAIDHIDYIYTDGSKRTMSYFTGDKAIRQMKVYFKNGIQSDNLFDFGSDLNLSFDATYPDGTPIKDFDTFNITGSFSCDELGSTDNIGLAQVMLAPTQELTDGMMVDTNQDELSKAPNSNGNFIGAIIRNDGFQYQGHLTNPIFYFKYNGLMVPDLSEISASYDNQNKELGSTGLTYIDDDKIHSSIITDSTGQKFIKVQVDGEYYYGGSSNSKSGFNVQVPIANSPDALTATKDWSWYVLNNSDEAKTESTIQSNKMLPVTVDGNTLSVGGTGTWQIITAQGFTSGTETQGNLNGGPSLASAQDDHRQDPTHFILYDSIINATNDAKSDLVSVANLPSTQDGKSQFDVHMTGKASLINVMTGQTYDAAITYSYNTGDNNFITSDQVTDWSKVKSIKVVPNGGTPSMTSLRLVVPVEDKTIYDDIGKTIYMSTITYGEDKANTKYTTKDGFAIPEKSTILPIIIKAGDMASAKLAVQGQATVHTLVHYKDANGKDIYVKLPDQDKTYNELQDTMKRSDYLQSDSGLTTADRGLLPIGMVINYNDPTIRNSNNTYAAGYANGTAAFDKTAKYNFDGDQVIFEGAMPEVVTKTHQAKETIHYVYRDGGTAKPDKVLTSVTVKQTGYKNPFTGEITWDSSTTDTLNNVDSPEITGYIADQLTVPSYTVTIDSPDKEVTVTYDADNENADFTYFDDTINRKLKVVTKSGKSNASIGYTTTDEINNYKKQGYALVSDDTDGRDLNFDSLPTIDQHYTIHLKHKIENVPSRSDTVTRTIHYLYDNGKTAQPDKTQTVSFNETGTKDDVTGETTWDNDDAQTVDSVITPSITGYTPDQSSIDGQTFKFGDKDVEVTVTYHPDQQKAKVLFIDDTAKTTLDTHNLTGAINGHESYNPSAEINQFVNKHYVFVSSDYPDDGFTYDNDDSKDQVFEIHLKHGSHDISDKKAITETITYKMSDDSKAPDKVEKQVEFSRVGQHDDVTNTDTWDKWQPGETQTFDTVPTPDVKGYTPDIKSVEAKTVTPGDKDITVTVTYNPDQQKAKVLFIDDTAKTTLDTHNLTGAINGHESYNPSAEIDQFVNKHYVFVSSDYPDDGFTYDNDDGKDQVFEIHLKHGSHDISDKKAITETITYKMSDDSKAPDKVEKQVEFSRVGKHDDVTNTDTWDEWQPNTQSFSAVPTPEVTGYTPDIKAVEAKTVTSGDKDITVTVTYTPDQQKAKVLFIDDTAKTTLDTHNLTGVTNGHESYSPSTEINQFVNKHYVLVSSDYPAKSFTYDNDDSKDQVFEIHLKHGTHKITDKRTVTETVTYRTSDGSETPDKVERQVEFNRDGYNDEVTKQDHWNKWQPNKQTFSTVPTPEVKGYTPDIKAVEAKTVTSGDKDITVTVTYTPDQQKAKVVFIDDTAKTTLDTHNLTGATNGHESYNPSAEINQFVNKHYVLVSSDYPDDGFTYDNDDSKDQVFEIHLKHGNHDISDKKVITETITYKMSDDSKAPDKIEKQVEFSRVGTHDDVTNTDTWDKWQPNKQSFSAVPTPDVKGYTPDIKLVEAKTVTSGDKDITVTVTYTPDQQKAKVVFIDDTTKKTLDTHNLTGVTNGHEKYSPFEEIEKFIHENYVLVSSDYPEKGFTYDNDDSKDQVFEIHFKEKPSESDIPTIPDETKDNGGSGDTSTDNGGSNDTSTDFDNPEKGNGGSDTVDKSSHKTPVKRNGNKKHHSTKKTKTSKISKTAKLNPNKVNTKANRFTQPKLKKVQESTHTIDRKSKHDALPQTKHDALPQTGENQNGLMAMLGLAISSLGMIGAMKSKKRKDN